MTEFWFPYGETKVFASLDLVRLAFEQRLPEKAATHALPNAQEVISRLDLHSGESLRVYFNATNHPQVGAWLNEALGPLLASGIKVRIKVVGPKGARLDTALGKLTQEHLDLTVQGTSEDADEQQAGLYVGYALPSLLFEVSGLGECLLDVVGKGVSENILSRIVDQSGNEAISPIETISAMTESFGDIVSVVFLPRHDGLSTARIGSLVDVAKEVVLLFRDTYGLARPEIGGVIGSLGGHPFDLSFSDSLDLAASITRLGDDLEYGLVAEWRMGLGDEAILHSFRKNMRDLERDARETVSWPDLTAYVLKSTEMLKRASLLTALPHTHLRRTIGSRQYDTANKLAQRVLRAAGDKGIAMVKSIPTTSPRPPRVTGTAGDGKKSEQP